MHTPESPSPEQHEPSKDVDTLRGLALEALWKMVDTIKNPPPFSALEDLTAGERHAIIGYMEIFLLEAVTDFADHKQVTIGDDDTLVDDRLTTDDPELMAMDVDILTFISDCREGIDKSHLSQYN